MGTERGIMVFFRFGQRSRDDQVTPKQLAELLENGTQLQLIDVRNPHEWNICRIPGAKLIPLPVLPRHVHELDKDALIVVYCHHGSRSARAVAYLRSLGFTNVKNLVGGIDAYSRTVDPSIPRY